MARQALMGAVNDLYALSANADANELMKSLYDDIDWCRLRLTTVALRIDHYPSKWVP
jgi:hypothetical protein